jgi:hypothetical protein
MTAPEDVAAVARFLAGVASMDPLPVGEDQELDDFRAVARTLEAQAARIVELEKEHEGWRRKLMGIPEVQP